MEIWARQIRALPNNSARVTLVCPHANGSARVRYVPLFFCCTRAAAARGRFSVSQFLPYFILFIVAGFALPKLFRLSRRSPREKARAFTAYTHKRGYALVNPALAQAVDM